MRLENYLRRHLPRIAGTATIVYGLYHLTRHAAVLPFPGKEWVAPLERKDIPHIRHESERVMAGYLLKLSYLRVYHEPHMIELEKQEQAEMDSDYKKTMTPPDFWAIDTRTGRQYYFEVTGAKLTKKNKRAQAAVMDAADIPAVYVQIGGAGLKKLQQSSNIAKTLEDLTEGKLPEHVPVQEMVAD